MSWAKREPVSNLVILGDDEGNVRKVGGLLAAVTQDTMYPTRHNYELVQKTGESIVLAGAASLSRQIAPADVGKFLKAEFLGWGKAANGKFKQIEVFLWEGEPTDPMKAWPRYGEFANGGKPKAATNKRDESFEDFPDAPDGDDSDSGLPF